MTNASAAQSSGAATELNQIDSAACRAIVAATVSTGVIVDDELAILEFLGNGSSFFDPSPGMATLDLLRVTREEIRLELRRAIDEARTVCKPVLRARVTGARADAGRMIDLRVIPFWVSPASAPFFVVLFEDSASAGARIEAATETVSEASSEAELRRDLASTRERLQSIVTRLESSNEALCRLSEETALSNEELQCTNEELRTAKEELLASNDELRTAKEDLQASNDELRTINEDANRRNAISTRLADDLANVLQSAAIPIVILGRDLRIRRFTPAAGALLSLIETDVGRPMNEIPSKLCAPDLPKMLDEVLLRSTPRERTVHDQEGRWYRLAVRPYVTADHRIDGAVLSVFDDTTVRQQAERKILEYQEKLQQMAFDATVAEEQERRRIAVGLHDQIGQALAAARLKMMSAYERTSGAARDAIQEALDLVAQTIADTRTLMFDLSPPVLYDLGFRDALGWLAEQVEGRYEVHVEITERGTLPQLDETTAAILFRSVRELLMNVVKHSNAGQVDVSLRTEAGRYEIEVSDKGRGFDLDAAARSSGSGFGLFSIREQMSRLRGTLEIVAAPARGTRVALTVPIETAMGPAPTYGNGR